MFDPKNMIDALISGDKPSVEDLVKTELTKEQPPACCVYPHC